MGYSAGDFAKAIGCHFSQVGLVESGRRWYSETQAKKAEEVLQGVLLAEEMRGITPIDFDEIRIRLFRFISGLLEEASRLEEASSGVKSRTAMLMKLHADLGEAVDHPQESAA